MASTIDKQTLAHRRNTTYLILSSIFISTLSLLNVISITKFIQLGPLTLAVGALPYPLTFLCTDLVSELYGKKKANQLVWLGFGANILVVGIIWLCEALPSVDPALQPPWQTLSLKEPTFLPSGAQTSDTVPLFHFLHACTNGAVFASMLAYLAAQFCDVHVFHYLKKITRGKYLWIRNNGSTMISQLVDSTIVISVTFGAMILRGEMPLDNAAQLLLSNYAYKFFAALLDTIPIYILVKYLAEYLKINPYEVE